MPSNKLRARGEPPTEALSAQTGSLTCHELLLRAGFPCRFTKRYMAKCNYPCLGRSISHHLLTNGPLFNFARAKLHFLVMVPRVCRHGPRQAAAC